MKGALLIWLDALVKLRDNIMLTPKSLSAFDPYHINLFRRVRIVANNLKPHMLRLLNSNKSPLTKFVRTYWADASGVINIQWRQAPEMSHVFLGIVWPCRMLLKFIITNKQLLFIIITYH